MTRRLRVVHITGCLEMGGQEKLLVEFARHADRDRFELRFVSLDTRGLLAEEIEAQGWPVESLGIAPGFHAKLPLRLAQLLRGWGADVIHTHNERPLIYGAPAARLVRGCRVIHTKHGRGTGQSRRQTFLTSVVARLTHHFVCVSRDCEHLALRQGILARKVRMLHNGIDTRRFAQADFCADGPATIVARLCPDKDHATLLKAVALVVRQAPEFRLVVAGDGPCLPELRRLTEHLGLAGHVRFLGLVRDVPELLRQARMKVLSSVSEGVSLTLLEAMAVGLPIVATSVGGTPEVVEDEASGLLVPPRNPAALAAALLRVQCGEALARRLGQQGRKRVEASFDVRRMVESYEALYCGGAGEKATFRKNAPETIIKTERPAEQALLHSTKQT